MRTMWRTMVVALVGLGLTVPVAVAKDNPKGKDKTEKKVITTKSGLMYIDEKEGTGEEATFSDRELATLLSLAQNGIRQLAVLQKETLGKHWPFPGTVPFGTGN